MARTLPILTVAQRKEFESPPHFSYTQRRIFFSLPEWAEPILKKRIHFRNQVGFILQLGYFKASGRFFHPTTFHKADHQYVCQRLKSLEKDVICYDWATIGRHRQLILSHLGVAAFKEAQRQQAFLQAIEFAKRQMNPMLVFQATAEYIRTHRVEVPAYATLALIITEAFRKVEEEISSHLQHHLTPFLLEKLDTLLETAPDSKPIANKPYQITLLKRNLEVLRPAAIKSNVRDYLLLKELYQLLRPLLQVLALSDEMISYYAHFVIKAQVFQVVKKEQRKYLMLICFIVYQYYRLSDLLIETLLSTVRTTHNTTAREDKERIYQQHQNSTQLVQDMVDGVIKQVTLLEQLQETALSSQITEEEKFNSFVSWINGQAMDAFKSLKLKAEQLKRPLGKDDTYYQVLEERSRSLQSRISEIMRHVDFDLAPAHPLQRALEYFKQKKGHPSGQLPEAFLRKSEVKALEKAVTKVSLYKVLLATHLAEHIKGGKANVATSFRYKAFESYLINEYTWRQSKNEVIEKALLHTFSDSNDVLEQLRIQLEASFQKTFARINSGANLQVEKKKNGKPRFITPAQEPKTDNVVELFPQHRFIPIYEVLHTVNQHCQFTHYMTHWNPRFRPTRPADAVFFAGLMGYGCNLGLSKLAHTSKDLSLNTLENTVNWYFSLENLQKANDAIVQLIGKLKIGKLFRADTKVVHSSSDGQKFYIQVDSIHANYSYKYFGKEKGIVIYSFIDEMHRLYYSTTFSSSEREATYVIDGLMHHPETRPDVHSTDTHGYTEVIFALTYLLGISFAPRIKGFQEQNLYPMEGMQVPSLEGYELKIGAPINIQLIKDNWDSILRVVTSIKLKHTSASSLLRRLSSYSRQHPVYQALKELGKAVRTEFLLRYMDEEVLRKRIDNQLQKIESAHHFSRAVFYGNNGEIRFAGKEEQLLADACKRLIQNSIICWNYLYLTQLLLKTPENERPVLVQSIRQSSPVSWQHINLQGEFDFSEQSLNDVISFDLLELLNLDVN